MSLSNDADTVGSLQKTITLRLFKIFIFALFMWGDASLKIVVRNET
jgi:hypothetical protein